MDTILLKRLLAEGESSRLDYKEKQYPLASATDQQKGELLKDILGLANAQRELEAFILVGVADPDGATAEVVGIAEHIDDADVQQLVRAKVNRPIDFSYRTFEVDGKIVGVFRLPVQRRPFYLKKDFGRLLSNTVYMKSGTSTVTATPDEIYEMGVLAASREKPTLSLAFAAVRDRENLGSTLVLNQRVMRPLQRHLLPPPIEDERDPWNVGTRSLMEGSPNPVYWEQLAQFVSVRSRIAPVGFTIHNSSDDIAEGVVVKLTTPDRADVLIYDELPDKPLVRLSPLDNLTFRGGVHEPPDVSCVQRGSNWEIIVTFGKVKAGATEWTEDVFFVGTIDDLDVDLVGSIYGDNFPPMPIELHVQSRPNEKAMTDHDLMLAHAERD